MSDDPYKPPAGDTQAAQTLGQIAWSQQSIFGAFFGGTLGAFIGVALWIIVVILAGDNSIIMGLLVALCVGLFVRFNGRGLTSVYAVIAAFFAWLGVVAGMVFTGAAVYGFIGFGVFIGSGALAAGLAKRRLDPDTMTSVWRLRNGIVRDGD